MKRLLLALVLLSTPAYAVDIQTVSNKMWLALYSGMCAPVLIDGESNYRRYRNDYLRSYKNFKDEHGTSKELDRLVKRFDVEVKQARVKNKALEGDYDYIQSCKMKVFEYTQ